MEQLTIFKGRVIDGNGGAPIEKGIVAVSGNRIQLVCREDEFDVPENAKVIEIQNGTVMPGFIDQHVHIGMGSINHKSLYSMHPYEKVCYAIRNLSDLLNAGFTTVRDCGGVSNHLKNALATGLIEGPRVFSAGRTITQTNGHFDQIKSFPIEFNEKGNILAYIADGVPEVRKAARMNLREGADFLKCMLSAGVVSQSNNLETQEFADEEIKAMVEEANKIGTYVAAHSISNKAVKAAVRCGVKSIEHAYFLQEDDLEGIIKNDHWVIPTLAITEMFMINIRNKTNPNNKLSPWLIQKMPPAYERQEASVRMARAAGVKVGFGTDLVGDADICPFGENGREFGLLVRRGGYTPMETITMATKFGSEVVMNPDLGTLEKGKLADIVVVKGDPVADIDLLANKDNIPIVMKDGVVKKNMEG